MSELVKHTPGPWTAHIEDDRCCIESTDEHVASLFISSEYGVANARLIAAAPDLLEILETTRGNIMSLGPAGALPSSYRVWLEEAERCIALATGREGA